MNKIRQVVSNLFQSPMQNMSFVAYFSYVNEAGKVTARSLMDLCIVCLTALEEQEKKNAEYEENFKQIQEILVKLIPLEEKKQGSYPVRYIQTGVSTNPELNIDKTFTCSVCGKACKSGIGLHSHLNTHTTKE